MWRNSACHIRWTDRGSVFFVIKNMIFSIQNWLGVSIFGFEKLDLGWWPKMPIKISCDVFLWKYTEKTKKSWHGSRWALSRRRLNAMKLAHKPSRPAGRLVVDLVSDLAVLVTEPYCYSELAVSSLAVAITITSTHYAYPRREGQAELAWVAWLNEWMSSMNQY